MTARARLFNIAGQAVTAAAGTGSFALGAALPQHVTFANAGVASGKQVYYTCIDGLNAETGLGTFTSPSTLSRDSVISSTAAGAKITATADARIYLTAPHEAIERMIGETIPWPGATIPAGWLLCAGQLINRTTYAALFAVLSTVWGVGDGSTTFGVPDMRGRTFFGKDDMLGVAANRLTSAGGIVGTTLGAVGGVQTVILSIAQLPSHFHSVDPPNTTSSTQSVNHTHSGTTGTVSADHTHATTTGTESADHVHLVDMAQAGGGSGNLRYAPGAGSGQYTAGRNAAHTHSGTSGGISVNHTHAFGTSTESVGFTHNVDIAAFNSGSQGSGTAVPTVPPGAVFNIIIYTGVF